MNKLTKFLLISFSLLIFRFCFSLVVGYLFPIYIFNNGGAIVNESAYLSDRMPMTKISELWAKGDSIQIVNQVINGYEDVSAQIESPLYPAIIRFFYKLIPVLDINGIYILASIISSVFFALALFYLEKIFDILWFNDEKRFMVYAFLIFFPTSFFFSLVNAEALFLLLSVLFLFSMFKKKYLLASLFLGLSIASKTFGVVLLAPFAAYVFMAERHNKKFKMVPRLAMFLITTLIPPATCLYHVYSKMGSFDYLVGSSNFMFLPFAYFFELFTKTNSQYLLAHILNAVLLVFGLGLVIFSFIKLYFVWEGRSSEQVAVFVYALIYVLAASSFSLNSSIITLLGTCLPMFLLPAMFYEKSVRNGYLFGVLFTLLSLQAMFFSLFLSGIPVYVY